MENKLLLNYLGLLMTLTLLSFNPTGVLQDSKRALIDDILGENQADFLFLQETWLLDKNVHLLSEISKDYLFHAKSGIDCHKEIIKGRPSGGVAILWHKNVSGRVSTINVDNNRICSVMFNISPKYRILLISVYFPCDIYSMTSVDPEYNECIEQIELTMMSNDHNAVIIAGDLNTDLSRNVAHTKYLKQFVMDKNLKFTCEHHDANVPYTYESFTGNSVSTIDHFISSTNLYDQLIHMCAIDHSLNNSNHRPIKLVFKCDFVRLLQTDSVYKKARRPCWHKATQIHLQDYRDTLDKYLSDNLDLNVLNFCADLHCKSETHLNGIEKFCTGIIDGCLFSENIAIPHSKPNRYHVPFWTEKVKPLRDKAIFWHKIWRDCGRPKTGWVASIRRSTRSKYHNSIKLLKREENDLRKKRMAEHISVNNDRDLWHELKKLKPSNKILSGVVDGKSKNCEIADVFKEKYETLFSSVITSKEDQTTINSEIYARVQNEKFLYFTFDDINKAISQLNKGKSDGNLGFTSDHIINASQKCKMFVTNLFNCILIHGYNPSCFLSSRIVPIPKNPNGSLNSIENYRGISLCNTLSKVLDILILNKYSDSLSSSNFQLGFKQKHSTVICTNIFKEIINYYFDRGTNVYCCFVDATMAFDRIHIGSLFKLLLSRNVPGIIIRILFDLYNRQTVVTKWLDRCSSPFKVLNGVRQGAILSPILFSMYIDVLILKLKSSGIGCHIGNLYYGALGYADDLVLLCPSAKGLQQMLKICENYGTDYYMSFNTKKTVCMLMSRNKITPNVPIELCSKPLNWVKSFKYLGNIITPNLRDDNDIIVKKGHFISCVNNLISSFGKLVVKRGTWTIKNYINFAQLIIKL